ncbi:GspH/FimT family protein [Variovorax sp. J2P1-59]|uniref:GspH/FimT family pseudopilin n=1 Tax=Variovorax flavidus TaxID=3053501 RepID=UPI002576C87F|nr:GspH/FimT family protein [Variovorax sp. J2P1-59]MDM0072861.1 GspH/FimT family protein [Variovorax sp. J2P1-59]
MPTCCLTAPRRPAALSSGFSAVELLVEIAIAALLMALAMPSFGTLVSRYRLRHAADDLSAAIYLARAEALRRGGNVTLRGATAPGCSDADDWSCGWLVFEDADNDGVLAPDEKRIQVWPAPRGILVTPNFPRASTYLNMNRWGRFQNLSAFSFTFKSAVDRDDAAARVLCMSAGGRIRTGEGDKC